MTRTKRKVATNAAAPVRCYETTNTKMEKIIKTKQTKERKKEKKKKFKQRTKQTKERKGKINIETKVVDLTKYHFSMLAELR